MLVYNQSGLFMLGNHRNEPCLPLSPGIDLILYARYEWSSPCLAQLCEKIGSKLTSLHYCVLKA